MTIRRMLPGLLIVLLLVGLPLGILTYHSHRTGMTWSQIFHRAFSRTGVSSTGLETFSSSVLPKGERIEFLERQPIGQPIAPDEHPIIANVNVADLDQDGLLDVLVCDVRNGLVSWIRQHPQGVFTEYRCGDRINAPAHAEAVDIDKDGDLDLAVANMGIIYASNDRIGSVVILENDGKMNFTNHVIADLLARVTDVRAGDLDGDGDVDLAVAQFGYDDGETRWMENLGNWTFKSHVLQTLSGPINSEIIDVDGDGDLDIVTLVSQEWEEIYVHENDGRGQFTPHLVFGSSNEDFGSSWLHMVDLDKDGDPDILYSNGDAFDYLPPRPRPWHGVQWLENLGGLKFKVHRIGDLGGASSPVAADVDHDGDLDVVASSAYNLWEDPNAQSLVWFENNGRMQFTEHDIASSPTHIVTLQMGDFDGDGWPDFVTGGLHVYPPYDRMGRVMLWMNKRPTLQGD